ncbi:hypothetical protein FI667_g12898, partial [Globisporangium splendens]
MRMQQWCKWRYMRLLLLQFALVPAIASVAPMLPIDAPQYRVAVAWDDTQLACEPLEEEGDERVYHDAIVVVRRGQCSFQDKRRRVARADGLVMLLVNSEDTLLQLSGVTYDGSTNTKALSIAKADGESLLELLNAHSQQRDDDPACLSITLPMSCLEQAAARIQYLLQTNVPLIAYEYFMDELAAPSSPMLLRDFDALLSALTPNTAPSAWITKGDDASSWSTFLKMCALSFPPQYEFASTAALHASIAAVSLLLQAPHAVTKEAEHNELWQLAAYKLVDAGYYSQSAFCFSQIAEDASQQVSEYGCQLAFVHFVQGNLVESIPKSECCLDSGSGTNFSISESLRVAQETLLRGAGTKMSSDDLRCLHQAATGQLPDEDGHTISNEPLHCLPVVFAPNDEITRFYSQLTTGIDALTVEHQSTCTAEEGGALNTRPERAAYLQHTITPPTMFTGCQGIDVLPIQQAIHALRTAVHPNLQSQPFTWDGDNSVESPPSQEATRRRRIAFLSTWFRNHSVGKFLLGVVERLDRTKFHIQIYRCMHFLRFPDKLTDVFRRVADTFTELPVDMDEALALLREERIDVLIYPELGMDEWTLLLARHRIAPIQCVFWGHPITVGNPVVDYFISSEYFVSDFFDSDGNREGDIIEKDVDEGGSAETFMHHSTHFSEQVVLFRGLGTFSPRFVWSSLGVGLILTLMKLHPPFDDVLLGILERDPNGYIVLLTSSTQQVWKERLRAHWRRHHHARHTRRVLFLHTLPYAGFLALLSFADVILDPFPFGGGVTTFDALALGMYLAAGFLRYMNVTDTIVSSVTQYVALAIDIANDTNGVRTKLHGALRSNHKIYDDAASVDDWNTFLAQV